VPGVIPLEMLYKHVSNTQRLWSGRCSKSINVSDVGNLMLAAMLVGMQTFSKKRGEGRENIFDI
jgi:hypothetical protein